MKLSTRILSLAPLLIAGSAFAQFSPISPRINPLAGLPTILPNPTINPVLGGGVRLPSPFPGLSPTVVLSAPAVMAAPLPRTAVAAAAAAPAGSIVIVVPQRDDKIPSFRVDGDRENVRHPLTGVLPDRTIRLLARGSSDDRRPAARADQDKDDLDGIFDRGQNAPQIVRLPQRGPVAPSRRITTPEDDLERELGL
jgi:hypothetical protein